MERRFMEKSHVVVDVGPSTIIVLCEIILIVLKLTSQIQYSWELILSPIILVIGGAVLILLSTLVKLLKSYLF